MKHTNLACNETRKVCTWTRILSGISWELSGGRQELVVKLYDASNSLPQFSSKMKETKSARSFRRSSRGSSSSLVRPQVGRVVGAQEDLIAPLCRIIIIHLLPLIAWKWKFNFSEEKLHCLLFQTLFLGTAPTEPLLYRGPLSLLVLCLQWNSCPVCRVSRDGLFRSDLQAEKCESHLSLWNRNVEERVDERNDKSERRNVGWWEYYWREEEGIYWRENRRESLPIYLLLFPRGFSLLGPSDSSACALLSPPSSWMLDVNSIPCSDGYTATTTHVLSSGVYPVSNA